MVFLDATLVCQVLRAGLTLELEKAKVRGETNRSRPRPRRLSPQASQEEDRRHILNCIAGQATAERRANASRVRAFLHASTTSK